MLKYGNNIIFNPDKLEPLNIDRQSAARIPEGERVLEIGCATGFVGKYLINKKHCEVVGVELGKDEAQAAAKILQKVIRGAIQDEKPVAQLKTLCKVDEVY